MFIKFYFKTREEKLGLESRIKMPGPVISKEGSTFTETVVPLRCF